MSRRPPPNNALPFRVRPETAELWVIIEEVRVSGRPVSRAVLTSSNPDRAVMEAKMQEQQAIQQEWFRRARALEAEGRPHRPVEDLHFYLVQVKDLPGIDFDGGEQSGD